MKRITKIRTISIILLLLFSIFYTYALHIGFTPLGYNDISGVNEFDNLEGAVGDWEVPITKEVGSAPYGVVIEDANNDGYNDIVTINLNDNSTSILLWNYTTDDWDTEITKDVGTEPKGIFIGDANNDNYIDIVIVNSMDQNISILLWNNTLGIWNPEITKGVGNGAEVVYVGDADNDGYNDIVVSNNNDHNISIYLWNSTLSDWKPEIRKSVGFYPLCVYIGDANNDGYNDIVTSNGGTWNNISILLWNSTSVDWDTPIHISVGEIPISLFIGDANNDGQNDIVTANLIDNTISILNWNTTSESWDPEIVKPSGGFFPRSIFIADANNNGYNDVVWTNVGDDEVGMYLWNPITDTWDDRVEKQVGDQPNCVFVGDVNDDGHNDIVTADYADNEISIILAKAPTAPTLYNILPSPDTDGIIELNWSDVAAASKYYVYRSTLKITSAEGLTPIATLVETNYTDIISTNGIYYYVIVAGNAVTNSSISNRDCVVVEIPVGFWKPHISLPVGDYPTDIFIGDVNNDGQNDIVTANRYDGMISILLWNTVISNDWYHIYKIIGNRTESVFVGDADNDGDNDIVTANINFETFVCTVAILPWNSISNDWDPQIIKPVKIGCRDVYVGDADNDGDNDIVTANAVDNDISILLWNGIDWDPPITKSVIYQPRDVFIGDADNDADNDIITDWATLLWNGTDWESQPTSKDYFRFFLGDANNDGQNEIATVKNWADELSICYWNGTDWDPQISKSVGDDPMSAFIGDADNDGDNDIVTANAGDNSVSILLWNTIAMDWDPFISRSVGDVPTSIFIGDVNNDGDNDIVTANPGDDTISILLWNEIPPRLYLDFYDQFFTENNFNITFVVYDENNISIENAMIQMWWNGTDVSGDVQNLGDGFYFISLDPITVLPGEDPILLNMIISADGFGNTYFETYIAVDPDVIDQTIPKKKEPIIPGYSIILLVGLISILSVFILKKRIKK